MLWFQALQENADELCQLIFASLIPGFPNPVDSVNWSKSKLSKPVAEEVALSIRSLEPGKQLSSSSNLQLLSDKEAEGEVTPLIPSIKLKIFLSCHHCISYRSSWKKLLKYQENNPTYNPTS